MRHKRKPVPDSCPTCGRLPAISKVKAGRWVVDCPVIGCKNKIHAVGPTEGEAVDKWNEEVRKL